MTYAYVSQEINSNNITMVTYGEIEVLGYYSPRLELP